MLQKIEKNIEKTISLLIPQGVKFLVNKNIMYQRWEIFFTSKNEYPRKNDGQYCFFAVGYYFKNKHRIEKNLFEVAKDLHKKWNYFMNTIDMNKPRWRGDWE